MEITKHAMKRIYSRGIDVKYKKLEDVFEKLKAKNIHNQALVVIDGVCYIVCVKNSTIITVLEMNSFSEHIFVNIEGACVVC